jgi:uncharacterized membrane protein
MNNLNNKKNPALLIAKVGIMAALCYLAFTFLQIKIPVGAEYTSFHLGNTFCVLAALLFGGVPGGIAGAIGMGIGDILDPVYITSAPKTLLLKFFIGFFTGLIAHKIGKISLRKDDGSLQSKKHIFVWTLLGATAGMAFNVIFEPIISYLYKHFILGVDAEAASILAKWQAATTFVNAILAVIFAVAIYLVLRPALIKAKLFDFNVGIKTNNKINKTEESK